MIITNTVSDVITIVRPLIKDQEQKDGRDIFEYDTDNIFNLSESFVSASSIIVYQNGTAIDPSDWTYNADTNQVTIAFVTSGNALNKGDIITITYNYYKKYSDLEITGYIQSSFYYFVKNRYQKIFEINDDDEIVAIDDLIPTTKELYFIAGITAILIDPMNFSIRTPEFTLSAQRDKSDQEQIAEAFTVFRKFVGTIEFMECD